MVFKLDGNLNGRNNDHIVHPGRLVVSQYALIFDL